MAKIDKMLQNINEVEAMARGDSCVHRLLAVTKVALLLAYLLAVVSFGRYDVSGLAPMFAYPVLMCALAGLPFWKIMRKSLVALPFVAFVGISNIIFDRLPAFYIAGFAVTYGMTSCASLMLKALLSVSAALIAISTTELVHMCSAMIALKAPRALAVQLLLTYRYISVLVTEAGNMLTAYHLRGSRQRGVRLADSGSLVGQLLLRSFARAERIYEAMKCRGFTGDLFLHSGKMDKRNAVVLCAGVAAIAALRLINVPILVEGLLALLI